MTPELLLRAFGAALRELRELKGMSQSDMGLDRNHVHRLELGEIDPKLTTLDQLAKALGISCTAFAAEMDRRRSREDPAAGREDQMLDGGILLMVRSGRMDKSKDQRWLADIYAVAKSWGAYKILLDLSGLICDYSAPEAFESAMGLREIFRELDYRPTAVAVVYNSSITTFGAKVARDVYALNVWMYGTREEALQWLRSQPE